MGRGCWGPVAATWSIGGKLVNRGVEAIKPDPGSRVTVVTDGGAAFNVVRDAPPSPRDLVASLREATGLVAQVDVGQPAPVVGLSTANLDDPNAVPLLNLILAGRCCINRAIGRVRSQAQHSGARDTWRGATVVASIDDPTLTSSVDRKNGAQR